ncbi:MAG TPA: hypothetical protein PLZ36_14775, partial [Armatimonadota bacterium]|nr:hypothetical protein [Armatimonadota bacterium]
ALLTPPPGNAPNTGPIWKIHNTLQGTDGYPWFTHFLQGVDCGWTVDLRAKLADPHISAEEKGRIRSELAAFCEFIAEPDVNTRASMTHQGNPNMPINRFMALPFAAALIPDHPKAKRWMDVSDAYVRYKLGMNVSPGGAWSELVTYYYASMPMLANGALVLHETGRLDDATRRLTLLPLDFTLQLISPPDPRVGARLVPGFGHEGAMTSIGHLTAGAHWLTASALEREHDPEKAAVYAWAWDQVGRPGEKRTNPFDISFEKLTMPTCGPLAKLAKPEAIRRALRSAWLPGFGAVLRAHAGEEGETYLGYRQGYMASHSDANQGDFTLYAKGAPLVPLSLLGYAISNYPPYSQLYQEFGWHSRVRFGDMRDWGGWPGGGPVSGIDRHFFSDSVDYLRGIGDYGPQRWTRQILFCKGQRAASPNYFVFRDSFSPLDALATAMVKPEISAPARVGELQPTWWYLRTLGHTRQVAASAAGLTYSSEYGPKLDVRFLQPASVAITSREASSGAKTFAGTEETITVNAAGPLPAGQDVLVVLYPRGKDEAAPAYESLGDGAAKITTRESTDYIFVSRDGMTYQQGEIAFTGIAGAVRVYPHAVHLVVAEGAGAVSYQGYTLKAGKPATKVIPLAEIAPGGTAQEPADPVTIAFPAEPSASDGPITELAPGVKKQVQNARTVYFFTSAQPIHFARDGVVFDGTRGGIIVDHPHKGTVQLIMLQGSRIGYQDARADVADGPYAVTYDRDRITAVTEGPARFIHLSMPAGLTHLPAVTMDGLTYAPGTGNEMLIIPVFAGRRT